MAPKFIFSRDIENLLKQGKTEMQLPESSRLSPAAWDMVREKKIQVSFSAGFSQPDDGIKELKSQKQPANKQTSTSKPRLVAVAAADREVSGTVGQHAGRSPYFLIFDSKGRFIDIVKNPYSDAGEGIGSGVGALLASSQVSVFVAEQFSPNIKDSLTDKNIRCFEISGPIQEAVQEVIGAQNL